MLIDLDEERSAGPSEPADRPKWTRWLAVLGLLPALALAAAGRPPAGPVELLAEVQVRETSGIGTMTGDLVVVTEPGRTSAYGHDGSLRWQLEVPGQLGPVMTHAERGHIVIYSMRDGVRRASAHRIADGSLVWTFEGWAVDTGDVLMVNAPDLSLSVLDPTGKSLWWRMERVATWTFGKDRRTVYALSEGGELVERRLKDGVVLRSAVLNVQPETHHALDVSGETIGIVTITANGQPVTHLTLDRQTFEVRPTPSTQRRYLGPASKRIDCGEVVCEHNYEHGQLSGIDKATGARLWSTPGLQDVWPTPAGLLLYRAHVEPSTEPLRLLSPATGQEIAVLLDWGRVIPGDNLAGIAPVMLNRGQNRTHLAVLGPGGLRVLGSVPLILTTCRFAAWRLACLTRDRRLVILEVQADAHRPR